VDSPASCTEHAGVAAFYRCDGCARWLCLDCARSTGRLLLCAHCGELAVPLGGARPELADVPERSSTAASAIGAPEAREPERDRELGRLLAYPLRGRQALLTAVILGELALLVGTESFAGEAGCLMAIPRVLLLAFVPAFMCDVTRSTAEGERDLAAWPEARHRIRELFAFLVAGALALIPAAAVLSWSGAADLLVSGARLDPLRVLLFGAGLYASALLWLPAYSAVVAFGRIGAALDLETHVRNLVARPSASLNAAFVCWLALSAGPGARALLSRGSLAGTLAEVLLGAYGAIVAARAAGFWMRGERAAPAVGATR